MGRAYRPTWLRIESFGPHGAEALDDLYPDLNLGRRQGLMTVLFPPQSSDILPYYLG